MPNTSPPEAEAREREAAAARIRFERLTLELASEQRFGGPVAPSSEVEIMDEAVELARLSQKGR